MLIVSLAASAALSDLGHWVEGMLAGKFLLSLLNTVVSLAIFTVLFMAIYKVLPDTGIPWRNLALGAFVTAVLFAVGKSLIGIYLGRAAPSSTLWRGRSADRFDVLGVLLRTDFSLRRRTHEGHRR
jgi:membrane protein